MELWIGRCIRSFVLEEAGAVVGFGEAFEGAFFLLQDPDVDVAGHADVEGAGWAAHDVAVAGLDVGVIVVAARADGDGTFVEGRCGRLRWV